ncbi:anti-sigma regulatory factor [Treponema sp. OMZ 840]|uniref:ATP-binding protein n=1 Tax=Treponema sp. OMZ 840 TaxID=244313 RepID=UPI003D8B5091
MKYHFDISAENPEAAGSASSEIKKTLKSLHIHADAVRRASIAMYEAEMNMVVHGGGGTADVEITDTEIIIIMEDQGPGIPDIDAAMEEGFSTASPDYLEMGYGAGMGLSNIKKNTDFMHIDSAAGKGTKLILRINYK